MEEEINKVVKSVYQSDPSVTGVIVVDESGLCLDNNNVPEEAAGLFASVAARSEMALLLGANQNTESSPVVQIEADSMVIIIKRVYGYTMGIVKDKTKAAGT
ncbi:hypothetical protein GGH12_000842 [Coemansia sp. RSA 1822]|nr:hypothetical protein LPJ76_001169 [Coemansia sp. RSA 638]KAJ2545566.1 hypothetical protein GGF49_000373 [Coemansia sp. RSA 1853]KAJ2566516.1 hypothetical protein GGH12_000842 [Coemansia sp. RSA 1822]